MSTAVFLALIIFSLWLFAVSLDRDRIKEDIESKGGELISKSWKPFGRSLLFGKSGRTYEVIYFDRERNKRKTYVKISLFRGMYFSDDQIIEYYGTMSQEND